MQLRKSNRGGEVRTGIFGRRLWFSCVSVVTFNNDFSEWKVADSWQLWGVGQDAAGCFDGHFKIMWFPIVIEVVSSRNKMDKLTQVSKNWLCRQFVRFQLKEMSNMWNSEISFTASFWRRDNIGNRQEEAFDVSIRSYIESYSGNKIFEGMHQMSIDWSSGCAMRPWFAHSGNTLDTICLRHFWHERKTLPIFF